jgi:prolyl-tRNA editing enzyme YbaK/EbsC (Cys-tRNA(Pro) deacylase)
MKTAVDVHNFLLERDIPHEMVATGGRVRSPERVAAVLGLAPEQVGRVVVFEGNDLLVAAVVPADRTPDPWLVRDATAEEVTEVAADRSIDLTEFLPEALPPVALPQGTSVLIDLSLTDQEVLYLPGGEATTDLKIRAEDLLRATEARVVRLVT